MHKKLIFCFAASSTCINFFQDLVLNLSKDSQINIISGRDYAFDQLVAFSNKHSINLFDINFPREITLRLFCTFKSINLAIKKIKSHSDKLIVISNTPIMSFMVAIIRLLNPNFQHIHFCHGLYSYNQRWYKKLFFKFFEQVTFYLSDNVIFVSDSLSEYATNNYSIPKYKLEKINSIVGVDISQLKKLKDSQFRIGFFGRVCYDKGFEDFYALYKMLPDKFSFVIAGPVDDKKYQKLLDSSDERFKYLGVIRDRKLFFNNIDLLFFPSKREGFGVSIIESSSYGVPTIAYDIVGVQDSLQTGLNGYKVDYPNISAAANIIKSLESDKNSLNELQKNSRYFVSRNFLKEVVLKRNLAKINELI